MLTSVSSQALKDKKECFSEDAYDWQQIVKKAYTRFNSKKQLTLFKQDTKTASLQKTIPTKKPKTT